MFGLRHRRREKWRQQPFPPAWLAIIEHNVPYYRRLTPEDQRELLGDVQIFLAEKTFAGVELEITDEIRVTIAAQACVLLLHRDTDYYPTMLSVVVYPHEYFVEARHRLPDGTVEEGVEARLGESWHRGEVVLSWDDVQRDAADWTDGHNVVFHEFAHQLDGEFGPHDGAPALPRREMFAEWSRVFTQEYEQLVDDVERHRPTVLRKYGATNPAEFFAVTVEAFFEKSVALRDQHPELYTQLRSFFEQDPAAREDELARTPQKFN
jgi:hypothetical protein